MVGLRWWNHVDEEGKSQWVFESKKGIKAGGRAPEKRVFWTGLIVAPVLWFLFFLSSFFTFSFQWTVRKIIILFMFLLIMLFVQTLIQFDPFLLVKILTIIALALNGANLYGYIRCKLGHNPGMSDATGIIQQGVRNLKSNCLSITLNALLTHSSSRLNRFPNLSYNELHNHHLPTKRTVSKHLQFNLYKRIVTLI